MISYNIVYHKIAYAAAVNGWQMLLTPQTPNTQAVGTSSCPHFTTKYLPPACMYKPGHTCPLYVYSSEMTFTIRIMK